MIDHSVWFCPADDDAHLDFISHDRSYRSCLAPGSSWRSRCWGAGVVPHRFWKCGAGPEAGRWENKNPTMRNEGARGVGSGKWEVGSCELASLRSRCEPNDAQLVESEEYMAISNASGADHIEMQGYGQAQPISARRWMCIIFSVLLPKNASRTMDYYCLISGLGLSVRVSSTST